MGLSNRPRNRNCFEVSITLDALAQLMDQLSANTLLALWIIAEELTFFSTGSLMHISVIWFAVVLAERCYMVR